MSTRHSLSHCQSSKSATYAFGCTFESWEGFDVVRFEAREALSELYEYDIVLLRKANEGRVDLDDLLGRPATFRIALADRWRSVHGIVAEAEELEHTPEILLYRVLLTPPFWRAKHEAHCRTFVDRSLAEIIAFVLEDRGVDGKPGPNALGHLSHAPEPPTTDAKFDFYVTPGGLYRFDVQNDARLRDVTLRSYVVQYNETNHDFVMRLLAEEGLSVVFSQTDRDSVLTITDRPVYELPFAAEGALHLRSARTGDEAGAQSVWSLSQTRRLRTTSVSFRDWDENRPQLALEGRALVADPAHSEQLSRNVFPGRDEAVRASPCAAPASVLLGREIVERQLSAGASSCKALVPGFRVSVSDDSETRDRSLYTIVAVRSCGAQLSLEGTVLDDIPFGFGRASRTGERYENRFEALPEEIVFCPAKNVSRPRIDGVQTAIVTAEEMAGTLPEIHCDERGGVRLRFPWDERRESGRPSSTWIRVSQAWAGAGFGTLMIPRVGQEVLVSYLQGDPERPVVVGRVYNAIEPTPYSLPESKTVSTWKSQSSPNAEGFNELRFEDKAGSEEIYLHAQKNLSEVVLGSHSESVGGDQSYAIGHNQSNTIGGRRDVVVEGNHYVEQAQYDSVCWHDHTFASVNCAFTCSATFGVSSKVSLIHGTAHVDVVGDQYVIVQSEAQVKVNAGSAVITMIPGTIEVDDGAGASVSLTGTQAKVRAGSAVVEMAPGLIRLDNGSGASILLVGSSVLIEAGGMLQGHAGNMVLDGGAAINAKAGVIHLNG